MITEPQSQFPIRNKNAIYFERDAELSELNRQGLELAVDIGIAAGKLGKKGMEVEQNNALEAIETITEKYDRQIHSLKDELDLGGEYPSKNIFAAMLNGIFTFLGIKKRRGEANLSKSEALDFQEKINELVKVTQARNQELSGFLAEISEKYSYTDSLSDVPLTQQSKEKLLGYVGRGAVKAFGNCPEAILPGSETNEMQDIGHQFMEIAKEHLRYSLPDVPTDISAMDKPVQYIARPCKSR